MNSEIPSIPESDNANFEPIELKNEQQEAQLEDNANIWSDAKDVDVKDADTIEITFEPQSVEATLEEPEPENQPVAQSEWQESDSLNTEKIEIAAVENSQPETTVVEPQTEPELFADRWLEESDTANVDSEDSKEISTTAVDESEIDALVERKVQLQTEIESLQVQKEQMLLQQIAKAQESIGRIVEEGLQELQERKTALQIDVEKLERRKERINLEMRRNFAGSSQELAVRVQGFKNYLVGSLQDLAAAADKLELAKKEAPPSRSRDRERVRERDDESGRVNRRDRVRDRDRNDRRSRNATGQSDSTQFSEPTFAEQGRRIRQLLDKYRNNPDYYGSPWQLRRTFEPTHAKRVQDWFFTQGGRGAIDSMGSRLQNILVASAAISVLHNLHGDRCRVLVLTDTPENLGEWRRGLQDCLGIPRSSFGANRGVVLFDSPEVLVQAADRLIKDKLLPVIIVDETEELLNLSVLKFPLWLAFASTGKSTPSNYLY